MSSTFCCRRPRTISPILEVDESRNWTQQPRVQPSKLSRPTGSTGSRHTFRRADDPSALKAIFGNKSEDGPEKQMLHSRRGIPGYDEVQQQQELRPESGGSFSIIKSKIRKKLSRNLASSGASVGGDINPLGVEPPVRYREESERSLQEDLLTDKGVEEGGYDVDARFIETPVSTDSILGHLEGVGLRPTGVNHLTKEFQRVQMAWGEPDGGQGKGVSGTHSDECSQWPIPTPKGSIDIFPRSSGNHSVLGAGACALISVPNNEAPDDKRNADNNIGHPYTRNSPPLHYSHGGRSGQVSPTLPGRRTPELVEALPGLVSKQGGSKTPAAGLGPRSSFQSSYSLKVSPSPLFIPFQTQSSSDSISKNVWHLSSTGIQRHSSLPRLVSDDSEVLLTDEPDSSSNIPPDPSEWLDGVKAHSSLKATPSLTQGSRYLVLNDTTNGDCTSPVAYRTQVGTAEDATNTRVKPELELRLIGRGTRHIGGAYESHYRTPSESLMSTYVPRRQTPQALTPSVSLPQLSRVASHRRGKPNTTNSSARELRARHHRYSSSSGFGSTGIPISWGRVLKDETSSLYLSRSSSISSTTKCSVTHAPSIGIPRTRASTVHRGAGLEPPKRDLSGQSLTTTDDSRNSKSKKRRHTVGSPGVLSRFHDLDLNSTTALPRVSKFMEDLQPLDTEGPSASLNIEGYSRAQSGSDRPTTCDGSQEWNPLQNLEVPRSNYDPEGDAATVWERALRNYDYERTSGAGSSRRISAASRRSRDSLSQANKVLPMSSPVGSEPTASVSTEGDNRRSHLWIDFSVALKRRDFLDVRGFGDESVSPGGSISVSPGTKVPHWPLPRSPAIDTATAIGAWNRYPSHTRHLRSESADATDRVLVKDFAKTAGGNIPGTSATVARGKIKSRSMTFGKGMFRRWGKQKLFRSQSMNFKRAETGHRSSIATGGYLSYPELEIIPASMLSTSQEQVSERSRSTGGDGALTPPTAVEEVVVTDHHLPTSAKTWSQLYEDCVAFPRDVDDASLIDDMQLRKSVEHQTYPRRSHPSGAQAMMRKSAMELR
ncbi:MAG: hypothetical protein M1840_006085 [Geoglossum simile]|nr:MAG: hypothetical protein M1840_006085 [Geoglossum simile]